MNSRQATATIKEHCKKLGIPLVGGDKPYVISAIKNLVSLFSNWNIVKSEIDSGQGSELKPDSNGVIKFHAVHSSTALCVNNFAPFKEHHQYFAFCSNNNFKQAVFEKKLPTGISTPNLDFYLESDNVMIGVESKFTEILQPKLPNTNLDKYIARFNRLGFQDEEFKKVLEEYRDKNEKMYLDVAQLLKHVLGLLNPTNNSHITTRKLVYIYWQPTNWMNFPEYLQHKKELAAFSTQISNIIDFTPMTYAEFWDEQIKVPMFQSHIQQVRNRYEHNL